MVSDKQIAQPKRLYFTTDLQGAAFFGDLKLVKRLLIFAETHESVREGILAETQEGLNALHMAVLKDNIPAMRILLRSKFYKRFLENPERNLKADARLLARKRGSWPSLEACRTILVNVPEFAPQLRALYPKDLELHELYTVELSLFAGTPMLNYQFNPEVLKTMLNNVREFDRDLFEVIRQVAQVILTQPLPNHWLVEKLIKRIATFLATARSPHL